MNRLGLSDTGVEYVANDRISFSVTCNDDCSLVNLDHLIFAVMHESMAIRTQDKDVVGAIRPDNAGT